MITLTAISTFLLLPGCQGVQDARRGDEIAWPRESKADGYTVVTYQPQIDEWKGEQGKIKNWGVSYRGMDPARQDLTIWGKVTKKYEEGGEALVDLDVGVAQPDGTQTTPGTATVALPKK